MMRSVPHNNLCLTFPLDRPNSARATLFCRTAPSSPATKRMLVDWRLRAILPAHREQLRDAGPLFTPVHAAVKRFAAYAGAARHHFTAAAPTLAPLRAGPAGTGDFCAAPPITTPPPVRQATRTHSDAHLP